MLQSRWTALVVALVTSLSILVPTIAVGAKTGSTTQNPKTAPLLKVAPSMDPIKQLDRIEERRRLRAAKRHDAKVRKLKLQWREEKRRAREAREAREAAAAAAAVAASGSSVNQQAGSGTAPNAHLATIAECESGGDPGAVSPNGMYRGKYQFSMETWAAVGGSGDPAQAPESVQDAMAAKLYATAGPGQWPVCQGR